MRTTPLLPLIVLSFNLHGQAGALDSGFSSDGKTTFSAGGDTQAKAVVIQTDGKILVAGSGGSSSATGRDFVVARYLVNGELDPSFDGDGIATKGLTGTDEASCLALQPDGKILVAGYYTIGTGGVFLAVVRLNQDGSADTGFGLGGQNFISLDGETPTHSFATGIAVQPDGRILVGGYAGQPGSAQLDLTLARFDPDGSIDESFGTEGISTQDFLATPNYGNALALQSDGRIVLVGNLAGGGLAEATWSRFDITGGLDPVFGPGGGASHDICPNPGAQSSATCINLLLDGKILVGGTCGEQFAVARITSTGVLDQTFGTYGTMAFDFPQYGGSAHGMAVQGDGKIVLAGTFNDINAPSDLAIARCNADGSADPTFGTGGWQHYDIEGLVDHGTGMVVQSDGKIVVVGTDFSIPTKGCVIRVGNDVGIGVREADRMTMIATVFPNPIADRGEVRYNLVNGGDVDCRLLDMTGRCVRVLWTAEQRTAGAWTGPIDMRGLASGSYVLELRTAEASVRLPLVKE